MSFFILFTKGCVLGITAIIPGMSIGTMALVMDVYEKCIDHAVVFFKLDNWRKIARLKNASLFLLPLMLGALISTFLVSKVIFVLFEQYRIFLQCVFLGMICGSIPYLFKNYIVLLYRGKTWLWFCVYCSIGFMLMYFLSRNGDFASQEQEVAFSFLQVLKAFLCGIVSAAAAVVPGISGSYVLLLLGYYETLLYIISTPLLSLLAFFLTGAILGFIGIAFCVHFLFHTFPKASYAMVLGIVLSSLGGVISIEQIAQLTVPQVLIAIVCVFCGMLFITAVTTFQKHAS